ncbi:MAG TPA: hypothetical protein VEX68_28385 [Bryobacteraceae bacterium]|nr:hypothetical protein [Bryobacteraceae bacterium]
MRVLIVMVLGAMCAMSQEATVETKPSGEKAVIIPVKTLSGDSFNRLAKMLSVFNVRYVADDHLRTIVVYAKPEVIEQMRRVVEELDRPGSEAAIGRNIEMTMAFLRCSMKPRSESMPIPADLESAVRQLRAATQYKHIEVWDILPLRLQEGKQTEQNLVFPGSMPEVPGAVPTAQIHIRPEAVTRKDSSRYVRFDQLRINLRVPYLTTRKGGEPGANLLVSTQFNFRDVGLSTSGDFKEGQKTILGKISGTEEDTAIFVVISLKVLE